MVQISVLDHHTPEDKKDKSDKNEPQEHIKVAFFQFMLNSSFHLIPVK